MRNAIAITVLLSQAVLAAGQVVMTPEQARTVETVLKRANQVIGDLDKTGRLDPAAAKLAVKELTDPAVKPGKLPAQLQPAYWRAVSYSAPFAGDLDLALKAGQAWLKIDPENRMAGRNLAYLHFMAGKKDQMVKTLKALDRPENEEWRGWIEYAANLSALVDATPQFKLDLGEATPFNPTDHRKKKVIVLDFWSVAVGGEQNIQRQAGMLKAIKGKPVVLIGINCDTGDDLAKAKRLVADAGLDSPQFYQAEHRDNLVLREPFRIKAAPTICVIGIDGKVRFAGLPGTWEPDAAVAWCLSRLPTPTTAPDQTTKEPAGRQDRAPMPPTVKVSGQQDERAARKLFDEGMNYVRLGRKTHNSTMLTKGMDILREVVVKYGKTQSGREAAVELRR